MNRLTSPAFSSLRTLLILGCFSSCWVLNASQLAIGQPAPAATPSQSSAKEAADLERKQKDLVLKLQKLEDTFLRMSELEAVTNPTHAGLLMQAAQLSKQLGTRQRLFNASEMLAKGQLSRAIQEQESAQESLKKLLELLQSENRSTRIREERARLEDILKELQRIETLQRSVRGRTESGQDLKQAKADQQNLEQQLESAESDLKDPNSDSDAKSSESKGEKKDNQSSEKNSDGEKSEGNESGEESSESVESGEKKSDDSRSDDSKSGESKSEEKESSEKTPPEQSTENSGKQDQSQQDSSKQSKPQDSKQNEGSEKSEGSSEKSESDSGSESQSESSSDKQQQPKTREENARERVQQAKKRMQQAQQKMDEENRQEAVEEQLEAERELREAVDELEKILRQIREEEIERSLVDLESRLRRMNEQERMIREETGRLDKLEGDARDRTLDIQANKLAIEQSKVVMEGQRALLLLQDEGSSTAFPEALDQIVRDAQTVAKKLSQGNVSSTTQAIEDEILFSLEELLESLKQVQKKREENKRQASGQPGQGGSEDQPLVDNLAELRLLKTLQLRVNRRTQSLAQRLDKIEDTLGQVEDADSRAEMEELATRQQKIYEVTREILLKATQK